jgi:hypothetical protein
MQDDAMAHTANSCVDALDEVFGERGLWPPCSPIQIHPCFICGTR